MVEIADIKRLSVSSGDTVVVRVRGRLSRDVAASIRSQVQSALPDGVRAMVVDDDVVDITVLGRVPDGPEAILPLTRGLDGMLGVAPAA